MTGRQRIELVWPAKGQSVEQADTGTWQLASEGHASLAPFFRASDAVDAAHPEHIAVEGDRLSALRTLKQSSNGQVKLIYADLPRIQGFDESRAFQAEDGLAWNTWLSSMREHFRASYPLLAEDGVLVVQAGDLEEAYAKVILFETFGHSNYLGTIVWQSHYSPKGGKVSTELASIHENLICFAASRSHISRLSLPVPPKDYKNPDGDPRGDWQAKQKDAGRDTVKMTYNGPPYRWRLIGGRLPSGLWRVSPMSGVIWGTPTENGTFYLEVEVSDSTGQSTTETVSLVIGSAGDPKLPTDVWWRDNQPTGGGVLTISGQLPAGVAGKAYSGVLHAEGGTPFKVSPRPSRGWGFGEKTLIRAILEDRMYFGQKGTAIPEPKKYLSALTDGVSYTNVSSWWSGEDAGWTQDATKSLNELRDRDVITRVNQTSKPSALMSRLVNIFTDPGDVVVELFAKSADMMVAAASSERRAIGLFGSSRSDHEMLEECALPRMRFESDRRGLEPTRHYSVGDPFLFPPAIPGAAATIDKAYLSDSERLPLAILTSQGFYEAGLWDGMLQGESFDGRRWSVVLPPERFLQQDDVDEIVSRAVAAGKLPTIFYFRAVPDLANTLVSSEISSQSGLTLRRVPMDLTF